MTSVSWSGRQDKDTNFHSQQLESGPLPEIFQCLLEQSFKSCESPHRQGVSAYLSYLRWLEEHLLYLDVPDAWRAKHPLRIKLNDVYVPLSVQREEQVEAERQYQPKKEQMVADSDAPLAQQIASHKNLVTPLVESKGETCELMKALEQQKHLVILGEPGSGKSTMLCYLAVKCAQSVMLHCSQADSDPESLYFPILLPVASYVEHALSKNIPLRDFLAQYCYMQGYTEPGLDVLFQEQLAQGKCLILMDGLDEMVHANERQRVIERVEELVQSYQASPHCYILTSRIADYWNAPLSHPFIHYRIQEMDEQQVQRFLNCWCLTIEAVQAPNESYNVWRTKAKHELNGIMCAIRTVSGLRGLAANPLHLRILALIHRTGAQLPQSRIELYKMAAKILTQPWYQVAYDAPASVLLETENLTPLLSKLAYWLHVHKASGLASEDEFYTILYQEWVRLNDLDRDMHTAGTATIVDCEIKKFIQIVRARTGIFIERAPQQYGFIHLTFEEYYTARYLTARSQKQAGLMRQHLHDPHWRGPNLMALSYISQRSLEDVIDLLETLGFLQEQLMVDTAAIQHQTDAMEEQTGRNNLLLLQYINERIPIPAKLLQNVVEWLANELLYHEDRNQFQGHRQVLLHCLEQLRGSKAANALSPLLITARYTASLPVRQRAIEGLEHLGLVTRA